MVIQDCALRKITDHTLILCGTLSSIVRDNWLDKLGRLVLKMYVGGLV